VSTVAIVGAGPGLGAATARRFAAEGFGVALLARSPERLERLAGDLRGEGVEARGFVADARDGASLAAALDAAAGDLGPVTVLQYSPIPQQEFLRPLLDTTVADFVAAVEFSILGAVAAVHQVLPAMRAAGQGSILFVNGGSAVRPNAAVAGTSVAFAGESAFARMLHDEVAADGIHVAQLVIPGRIEPGHPTHDPAVLADKLWELHSRADVFRDFADDMPDH
jgi:NADP-dependent 3-hydroxy acid dehydrogenase YdfG